MAKKEKKENKKNKSTKQKGHYFKDMKAELKKVIWPTTKQLVTNTVSVISYILIIAVIVFLLDLCFDAINTYGITALQEKIQTAYSETEESTDDDSDEESSDEDSTDEDDSSTTEVTIDDSDSEIVVEDETEDTTEETDETSEDTESSDSE